MTGRLLTILVLAVAALGCAALSPTTGAAADVVPVPPDLPRYGLELKIDTAAECATFRQTITWTNRHTRPTECLVFHFYPHYRIPRGDTLLLAKTLELLRLTPSYGIDHEGRVGRIDRVTLGGREVPFRVRENNQTAFEVDLPKPLARGESVTIVVEGTIQLREKQGRCGKWQGIHYLVSTVPVVAYYDDRGWHDVPFVPWHQPFWQEAGVYTASITLPTEQVLACSADIATEDDLGGGWKCVKTRPFVGRDFAVLCSALYQEFCSTVRAPDGRDIRLRCVALPRHEFYAKEMLQIVADALPTYSKWFGPFPYEHFTIAESYFGWNGNECAGLVMIDERVFDMPKLGKGYVEYLVSHEFSHQWWFNQVGTNGYSETFIDEGAAVYFTHRFLDEKRGKNNEFLDWPMRADWLPNIRRDNYRFSGVYSAIRKDDMPPAAGPLPEFGHLANLFFGAYDRGSKVYALIADRLGPEFFPFIQQLVRKYSFRVLSADQLKAELTAFAGPQTAPQWDELFQRWVYGRGLTDWAVDSVCVLGRGPRARGGDRFDAGAGVQVEVVVSQRREYDEPTVLAFQFADGDGFPVRVPVGPGCGADVEPLGDGRQRVRVTLPAAPTQVEIDPERVLLDANPANNAWHRTPKFKLVPLYSLVHDTDFTNDYDRWNFTLGPWIWGATYLDPWYTRDSLVGVRAGAFRTQAFSGGAYVAIRPDYRDLVVGFDGLIDHWPFPQTQIGFNYERRISGPWDDSVDEETARRAVLFGRYVLQYGSSLYLPPFAYVDLFTTYQDNFLPVARTPAPGAVRPGWSLLGGLHGRINLYTPYWDPERGFWADLTWASGVADLGSTVGVHQLRGELAAARKLPDGLGYWSNVKLAGRMVVQGAFPDRGQFFALGGSTLFRGFDLAQRQGSFLWVANAEVRLPVVQHVNWNFADDLVGFRGVQLAGFYDVGNVYADGRSVGGTAHALGAGVRLDMAVFSFLERATIRFDVAKTINTATPFQFWFGVQQPF